jgi:cell division protein FtsL
MGKANNIENTLASRPKSDGRKGSPARGFSVAGNSKEKKISKKQTNITKGITVLLGILIVVLICIGIGIFNFYCRS